MSSTRLAQTTPQEIRSRRARPRSWLALAAIVVCVLGCCATLLSQGFIPTHINTNTNNPQPTAISALDLQSSHPLASATPSDLCALNTAAAQQQLNAATTQLALFESARQGQLAVLKSRQADPTQAAAAQQRIAASATTCYQAAARLEHDRQLTLTLEAAKSDPDAWSRIPADALAPQTDLRRLLAELKSAQAHTARLLETRLSAHPAVLSARAAEREIEASLQQELNLVLPERLAALQTDEHQLASLRDELQRQETNERQLAELAAEYNLYLTQVRNCEAVLRQAEQGLVAARDTHGASRRATIEVDNGGSVAMSGPSTVAASREPETGATGSRSGGSNHRLLLILVGGVTGLFACMSYFYLTSSRPSAPSLYGVTSIGHCLPQTTDVASVQDCAQPNESELVPTVIATQVAPVPAADTHFAAVSTDAEAVVSPPVASREPLRVAVCDPRGPRSAGRTTLRDALMRCAERAK